jgi:hypothetical protein
VTGETARTGQCPPFNSDQTSTRAEDSACLSESGVEVGRHRTNLDTLARIAHALDPRLVLGLEALSASGKPKRDLVAF